MSVSFVPNDCRAGEMSAASAPRHCTSGLRKKLERRSTDGALRARGGVDLRNDHAEPNTHELLD